MIRFFRGKYFFLSNFAECKGLIYDGLVWQTVEHAYQAMKCKHEKEKREIRRCVTPAMAKKRGRYVIMREDFNANKLRIMTELVRLKFTSKSVINHKALKRDLLMTGENLLIGGNYWHDNYWGACLCSKCINKKKYNYLGKILMKVRKELKEKENIQINLF